MGKHSRGFFFVLISFVFLLYIFLYLTAWINAIEISEKSNSEKFRSASIEGIVSQLSSERFSDFFEIAGYYALFKINNHSSDPSHPMKYDSNEKLHYLKGAFFDCVRDGNSSAFENQALEYSSAEMSTYTFYAWIENLNFTLSQAGLELKSFNMNAENFTQTDPVTFNASMTISIFVSDRQSTLSLNRTFLVQRQFNITGFPDPMIKREYYAIAGSSAEKQIFFRNVSPSSLAPVSIMNGSQGQGFFYGPMISAGDANSTNPSDALKPQYILVGNFSDVIDVSGYEKFGAYILTNGLEESRYGNCPETEEDTFNAMTYEDDDCNLTIENPTTKPFALITGLNMSSFRGPGGERRALIIAKYSVAEVSDDAGKKLHAVTAYDMEDLRDTAVCSYFLPSSRGPSYAQRLSASAIYLNDSEFGMEAFLVGTWAGGSDLSSYDPYSRVDFEFFRKLGGEKVRGMAGCKNPEMCAAPVTSEDAPLGHFALSVQSLELYGADEIACSDGRAGCG